jgi:predicted ATP-dependent protease
VDDLMLRADVVEAVAAGHFHIYPVAHVDQAIELLTGIAAGEPAATGGFPPGSVNGRAARRVHELSELRRRLGPARETPRKRKKP